jgi:hypothetical protein
MANWEVNKTKRYNKPIEEHDAQIRGQAFRIEASEGSDKGVLYLWNDLRGYERIASGSVVDLKRQAEGMGKREARGVAAIERRANYSRPGEKDTMGWQPETRKFNEILNQALAAIRDGKNPSSILSEASRAAQQGAFLTDGKIAANVARAIIALRSNKVDDAIKNIEFAQMQAFYLFSRPGAKATFKVEDRFYFGK